MHQLRLQTIAILSLVFCGAAVAYQETPGLSPNPIVSGTSAPSNFEPYFDKLKQDSAGSQPSAASKERVVAEGNIVIAWSENMDELRGFSTKIGDWEVLKVPAQKRIVPSISTLVGVVELEGAIAGFSASRGCWDIIELPGGVHAEAFVHPNMLTVQTPDHLYTFAAEKGQWTSPTDPELQPLYEEITLSNSAKTPFGQFQKWLESLPKHQARGMRLTNTSDLRGVILYAERQSLMNLAKQKLAEWGYTGDGSTAQLSSGDLAPTLKSKSSNASSSAVSVDVLRVELENLEAKIVDQLRNRDDSQDSTAKLAELRPQAEKAFDLRQQVLRLEAQRLQAKLKSIEESLQARENNRDDLVSKRLKELGSAPKNETQSSKVAETPKGAITTPTTIVQASGGYFEQVTSIARTLRALRGDALAIREDWLPHDNLIKQYSRPLADLIADGTVSKETTEADLHNQIARSRPMHETKGKELAAAMKVWRQAWSSYSQQVELLNLEVEKKRNELPLLNKTLENTLRLKEKGVTSVSEVDKAERNLNRGEIELREATHIVELFRQIAVDEPELNPDHDQK